MIKEKIYKKAKIIKKSLNSDQKVLKESVDVFFEFISFEQRLNIDQTCIDFKECKNGSKPIKTPIESILQKLRKDEIQNKKYIIAVSVGGTNIKCAKGFIDADGLVLEQFSNDKLEKARLYEIADAFWDKLFSSNVIDWMRAEGEKVQVNLTLACPLKQIKDDYIMIHGSGKYNVPELGPLDQFSPVSSEQEPIKASLSEFLKKRTGLNEINIVISPNDTISSELAYYKDLKRDGLVGIVVAGTGFNIAVENINFEAGHYKGVFFSEIDKLALNNRIEKGDLEYLVSGKIKKQIFRKTVKLIFGENDEFVKKVDQILDNGVSGIVSKLAYLTEVETQNFASLRENEKYLLKLIAQKITHRAAKLTADMIVAISKYLGQMPIFVAEGSVITKNPEHLKRVNDEIRTLVKSDLDNIVVVRNLNYINKTGLEGIDIDASLVGTFYIDL